MRIVYSSVHHQHAPPFEFTAGQLVPANEKPQRADIIFEHLQKASWADLYEPRYYGNEKILAVHSQGMVDLLEHGYKAWEELGRSGMAFPSSWPLKSFVSRVPDHIDGRLAYYCADTSSPLTKTSWGAIKASADCALTAADFILQGQLSAFALCRPPGHHSAANSFGGFCFLNNSAIAAQHLIEGGTKRIAILDIDYHHGNGTQDIFLRRKDVFTVSIHADPRHEYPYYWGHEDEVGEDEGIGYNLNLPLPLGSGWAQWSEALDVALMRIKAYQPDVLIVGLGVDTYKEDPISLFQLDTNHYPEIGARISDLKIPSLFVMEGGYAVDALGLNVFGVLDGFYKK